MSTNVLVLLLFLLVIINPNHICYNRNWCLDQGASMSAKEKTKKKPVIKPAVNYLIDKLISRKLTVFIIATWLLFSDKLTDNSWTYIAMIYMGVQGAIDILKAKTSNRIR